MKCYFYTFGCKVNTCETAGMEQLLKEHGYESTAQASNADIAVVNSCTVTASGDSRVLNLLRRLKKENPNIITVLTGCYAQAFPEQGKELEFADIIIGTKNRSELPVLIEKYIKTKEKLCSVSSYKGNEPFEVLRFDSFSKNTRAFLKVQDGCNCFCTYCIIPYTRGRCRSMPLPELKKAAKELIEKEHREIVLCGINLAFYGKEWNGSILDAVKCVAEAGDVRIRLGSLEPEKISEKILSELVKINGFCPQFHLSLQSGSDSVLKRMKRKYSTKEYYDLCCLIRKYFPKAAITTDIMVGFPGETEDEFAETLAFAENTGFAKIHVFRYSARPGTAAAKMKDKVQESVKTERMHILQDLGEKLQKKHLESLVGQTVLVLFEREKGDGFHIGHAPDGSVIKIPEKNTKKSLRKASFYVTIERNDAASCYGHICDSRFAN